MTNVKETIITEEENSDKEEVDAPQAKIPNTADIKSLMMNKV